jgi:hypothetical protein
MTIRRRLLILAATASVCAPASAHAQVFVDPGSPSGKEYAIPLESARRSAAGTHHGEKDVAQGERTAPLFGEGIGDPAAPAEQDDGQPQASATSEQRSTREGTRPRGPVERALRSTSPVSATVPSGGVGGAVAIGAVAFSVLMLGAVIGSIGRRRRG